MNPKTSLFLSLPAALICGAAALISSPAEMQSSGLNIAVVDFDAAVKAYPRTEQMMADQSRRSESYQAQISAQETKIEDLKAERDTFRAGSMEFLSLDERMQVEIDLLQRQGRRLQNMMNKETTELFMTLYSEVSKAIDAWAQQNKVDLVLRRWPAGRLDGPNDAQGLMNTFQSWDTLYSAPGLDRTTQVADFLKSWKPGPEPEKGATGKTDQPAANGK